MAIREWRDKIIRGLATRLLSWAAALQQRLKVDEQTHSGDVHTTPEEWLHDEEETATGDDLNGLLAENGPPKEWLDKVRAGAPHLLRSARRRMVIQRVSTWRTGLIEGTAEPVPPIRHSGPPEPYPAAIQPASYKRETEEPKKRPWPSRRPALDTARARFFSLKYVRPGPPPERQQPPPPRSPEAPRLTPSSSIFRIVETAGSVGHYSTEFKELTVPAVSYPSLDASSPVAPPSGKKAHSGEPAISGPSTAKKQWREDRTENPPEPKRGPNPVLNEPSRSVRYPETSRQDACAPSGSVATTRLAPPAAEEIQTARIRPSRLSRTVEEAPARIDKPSTRWPVVEPGVDPWPSLPEAQEQEPYEEWGTELRRRDRLARLEREQRGEAWNE